MIKEHENFKKNLLKIAIPISLQSLIGSSMGMIDSLMVGRTGNVSISAVGFGGQIFSILFFLLLGVTGGVSIFASQFLGKGDKKSLGQLVGFTFLLGGVITGLLTLCVAIYPEMFMTFFSKDQAVIEMGAKYSRITSFSYFGTLITLTYAALLRSTDNAKIPMKAGFAAVLTNTVLNYILIFGIGGFEGMGVIGAAYATLISRWLEAILLTISVYRSDIGEYLSLSAMFNISMVFAKKFIDAISSVIAGEFLWVIGISIYAAIYGNIGTDAFSAVSITYPIQGICFGIFSGLANASQVMIGKKLGSNDLETAFDYSVKVMKLTFKWSILMAVIVALISYPFASLYNVPANVQKMAGTLLILFSITFLARVFNMVSHSGILRSGGDTKFTLLTDIIGTWLIGIPVGLISAFVFHLPLHLTFLFISLEEVLRAFLLFTRVHSKKWVNNLVAEI